MVQPVIPNPIKSSSLQTGLAPKGVAGPKPSAKPQAPQKIQHSVDIIKQYLTTSKVDPKTIDTFIKQVAALTKSGMSKLVQIGETVFLVNLYDKNVKKLPTGTAEVFSFSLDPQKTPERIKVLSPSLKSFGINKAIFEVDDPNDIKMLKAQGVPFQVSQTMSYNGQQMVPVYKIEMGVQS
jgi:hypothetical protein